MSEGWQPAFVAMTVALGDSVDDAFASLGLGDTGGLPPALAAITEGLRSASRDARARTLARELSAIALAVDAMGIS